MAHLVQNRVRALLTLRKSRGIARQIGFREGHASGILHGPQVVFGDENLIVRSPRVGEPVALVEEIKTRARHFQNVVTVHERQK